MKAALAVLALVLAAAVWLLWRTDQQPYMDSRAVVAQVQRLNQLATVRYTVQKVVTIEEARQPLGSERILLILQASVTAGVDLAALRPEHVSAGRDGNVVVRLPRPQLLGVAVDEKSTRVWDRQKTWWTPWIPYSNDLEQRARIQGIEAVRQAALEMGILDHARRNAEDSIRGLLTLAGAKSVQVLPADAS